MFCKNNLLHNDSYIGNKNVCKNNIVQNDSYIANKNVCKNNIVHNDSYIANKNQNKKSNKITVFVIDDAISSLTLKGRPLKPNFRQGLYLKSYLSLYQAVSAFGLNKSFDIAKEDYIGKYSMWDTI